MRHAASQWIAPLCLGAALLYCAIALLASNCLCDAVHCLAMLCLCVAGLSRAMPVPHAAWIRFARTSLCLAIAVLRCPTLCLSLAGQCHHRAPPCMAMPLLCVALPIFACAACRS